MLAVASDKASQQLNTNDLWPLPIDFIDFRVDFTASGG